MSSPSGPQQYLNELDDRIGKNPLLPYTLAVEAAAARIDRALDPLSSNSEDLSDIVAAAKAEIRTLSDN